MKHFNIFILFFVFLFVNSCKQRSFNEKEYIKYINDPKNGFLNETKAGDVTIKLLHKPSCLFAYDDSSNQYSNYLYFNLSYTTNDKDILMYNINAFNDYSERVNILSYRMSQYITLLTDKSDTVNIVDAFFERTYGMTNETNVLFAFDKDKTLNNTNKYFSIYLKDIGLGIGDQVFRFKKNKIKLPPKLNN